MSLPDTMSPIIAVHHIGLEKPSYLPSVKTDVPKSSGLRLKNKRTKKTVGMIIIIKNIYIKMASELFNVSC